MRRLLIRIFVLLGVVLAFAAATGGPAEAHTGLLSSDPAAEQVLPSQPRRVLLTFREPVTAGADAVRVYDDRMRRVDLGNAPGMAAQQVVRAVLPGGLEPGTYTVAWRVISADGHPAGGTFRFAVGSFSRVVGAVPLIGGADESFDAAGLALGVLRGLGYVGLAVGPGVLIVVMFLWPRGLRSARTRRMIWLGLAVLATSALGTVAVNAVWANGLPIADAWAGVPDDAGAGVSDHAYAARFYCLLAVGLMWGIVVSLQRWLRVGVAVTVAALLFTWPLAGHAVTGRQVPLAIAADVLHLAAMTIWLGGLVLVAVSLSRARMAAELASVLPRFSQLAFTCVLVLVVTGTYQAWRELGSFQALVSTSLGRVLLVKIACVVLLVGLGALARRWVQRHLVPPVWQVEAAPAGQTVVLTHQLLPDSRQISALRRGLLAELGVSVAVLAVTAALVATSPVI